MNKLRLMLSGLIVIVLALAGGTAWLIYDYIQQQIPGREGTKQEIQTLKTRQDHTEVAVNDLQHDVALLKGQVADLTAKQGELSTKLATLQKQTDGNTDEINKTKQALDDVNSKLDKAKSDLKDLESRVDRENAELKKENADLKRDNEDAKKRLDKVEQQLAELRKYLNLEPRD